MYILQQIHNYSPATPRWHAPRHSQEGAHNSSQRSGAPLQCCNMLRTAQRISSACNTHMQYIYAQGQVRRQVVHSSVASPQRLQQDFLCAWQRMCSLKAPVPAS